MTIAKKLLLFVLALLIVTLPAMWMYSRECIAVGGRNLVCWDGQTYRAGSDALTVAARESGANFDLKLYGEQISAALVQEGEKITVTFDSGEVVTGYDKGFSRLMNADGSWMDTDALIILVGGELTEPLGKPELANRFFAIWKEGGTPWGPWWFPLVMALLYIVGVVHILWPEKSYFFLSKWRYNKPELSDEGLLAQKISGWIAIITSVALTYGLLLMP